ncbi:unnamed protein product, partial [Brassica napus]
MRGFAGSAAWAFEVPIGFRFYLFVFGFLGLSKSTPFGLYKSSVRDRFEFYRVRVGELRSYLVEVLFVILNVSGSIGYPYRSRFGSDNTHNPKYQKTGSIRYLCQVRIGSDSFLLDRIHFDSISYTFRLSDPWLYVKPSIGEGRDRDKEKRDMGSSQLSQAFIVLLLLCVIPALPKLLYRLINNHFQSSVSVSIQINNMHKSKLDL